MKNVITLACVSLISFCALDATTASMKSIGMAAACVSYPLDSGVMAFNPAGIVSLDDRVDTGCYFVNNFGSTTISGNIYPTSGVNGKETNRLKAAQGPESGGIYHLHPQVAIGLLVYNEKDLRVTYKKNFPLLGTSPLGFQYTLEMITPTLAVTLFDYHSFSVTFNYIIERLKIKGLETIANTFIPFSEFPNYVTNNGYDWSNGTAVTLGYRGHFFNDRVNVGFAWRSKGKMKKCAQYKGFVPQRGTFDVPEVFRAGISATPWCGLTFAFDYEFVHNDKVPAVSNPFKLFSPDLLGSDGGSGFGWVNQHIFRIGINYDWTKSLSFRIGYRTANCTFSGDNVAPNLLTLDVTNNFITTGSSYRFTESLEVTGLLGYGFRGHKKGGLPTELGGGEVQLEQQTVIAGIQFSLFY